MPVNLSELFRYNAWANQRLIQSLSDQEVEEVSILRLTGHLFAAEHIWLHRIKALPPPPVALWGECTLSALHELASVDEEWVRIVENENDLAREVRYENMSGKSFSNRLDAIATHVAQHGSYHRGQIAILMRQQGFNPVDTDFIIWSRVITGQL